MLCFLPYLIRGETRRRYLIQQNKNINLSGLYTDTCFVKWGYKFLLRITEMCLPILSAMTLLVRYLRFRNCLIVYCYNVLFLNEALDQQE